MKFMLSDLIFVVCVLVIAGLAGTAFENALLASLLIVLGGAFSWAVYREYLHRARERERATRK